MIKIQKKGGDGYTSSFSVWDSDMFKDICWVNWLYAAMIVFLFFVSVSSMLSGCGNKGDLYLPDHAATHKSKSSFSKTISTTISKKISKTNQGAN